MVPSNSVRPSPGQHGRLTGEDRKAVSQATRLTASLTISFLMVLCNCLTKSQHFPAGHLSPCMQAKHHEESEKLGKDAHHGG